MLSPVLVVEQRTATIEGMSCSDCEQQVETALADLSGILQVRAHAGSDTVKLLLTDDYIHEDFRKAVQQAGFDVKG